MSIINMEKKKERLVHLSVYALCGGKRYHFFHRKKYDRLLRFELISNKGEVDIKLINKTSGEMIEQNNLSTGMYEFNLLKENKYCFVLIYKKASGKTKITTQKL